MSRTKGSIIAGLASIATVLAVSAFLVIGCLPMLDLQAPATGTRFTDARDGKTYRIVTIGEQTWMAENLNYETADSWCYGSNSSNCATYGRLYTWDAAMGACPSGWHLPTVAEWSPLIIAAGGYSTYGKKLKTSSWGGTDDYGFSALPGGYRGGDGTFGELGVTGSWWTATEDDASIAYCMVSVIKSGQDKIHGYSVRCVQD